MAITWGGRLTGPLFCPEDRPYFDGYTCQHDPHRCCRDPCLAWCPSEGVQVPDPRDCHMYYICTGEGHPEDDLYFACDPNKVFDASKGVCVPGDQCVDQCHAWTHVVNAVVQGQLDAVGDVFEIPDEDEFMALEWRRYTQTFS